MIKTELRKAGKTRRTSRGETGSARGGWRRAVEEEPTGRTYLELLGAGRSGRSATAHRMLMPVRHLCRARDSTEQGCVCTFTGENIQPNVFIDLGTW